MAIEEWKVVESDKARAGGQGSVQKVVSSQSGENGALKVLHEEHLLKKERRFRFQNEANALVALAGANVPKLLDTNVTEHWQDKDTPLYIVMEWIEGPTLTEVSPRGISLDDSIAVISKLLDTIDECHKLSLHHRDLKPDNIILRDGLVNSPILVDFGMSWQQHVDDHRPDFATPAGQEIGNRFLRLPEYAPGTSSNDSRSDISMLVGLLFFLISGKAPRVLLDHAGNMPHEREGSIPEAISRNPRWRRLRSIFQRGFQNSSDLRYQTIEELREDLNNLDPKENPDDEAEFEQALGEVAAVLEGKTVRQAQERADLLQTAASRFLEAFLNLIHRTDFVASGSGPTNAHGGRQNKLNFSIARRGQSSPQAGFSHFLEIENETVSGYFRPEGVDDYTKYYSGSVVLVDELIEAAEREGRFAAISMFQMMAKKLSEYYSGKLS